ncbi:MAG: gas vesicle protein [Desulfitobacteriaceae bacterium]
MAIQHSNSSSSLADILERILDKGIVVAGDIKISLADVDLLNIKIRLLVASVDKAKEMGIDWWQHDPYLNSRAQVPPAITAPRGADKHEVFDNILQKQSVDTLSALSGKEEKEVSRSKPEAKIFEKFIKAGQEQNNSGPVIIDAIPVMNDPVGVSKISLDTSTLDNSSAEKFNSELREGRSSSLGKPSVGRSVEKIPR